MYQKIELEQLESMNAKEILAYKKAVTQRKTELEKLKAAGGDSWNKELQDELGEITLALVDIEELLANKSAKNAAYVVEPGTEKMLHLRIVRGRRYNPNTGKEESKSYIQKFTFSEWQLFKNNHVSLGYHIVEVLHDPYNEASEFVK